MIDISNKIYQYYLQHTAQLPEDKRFHFASRLYLWRQDEACQRILTDLRPSFTGAERPDEVLRGIIVQAQGSPVHGSKNAAELRRPYFERHPKLKTYVSILFRITFLYTVYGIDARSLCYDLFSEAELEAFARVLQRDEEAMSMLSTHAVNFFYLYYGVLRGDTGSLDPTQFLRIGHQRYEQRDQLHLQLLIYLYTHCIIGESLFYYRPIPEARESVYNQMIDELEILISKRFHDINLDNKFEFLVCCRILRRTTTQAAAILSEAADSFSKEGDFLIDRHNNNPQIDNVSFDRSEHRNALCIMASESFKPLQTNQLGTDLLALASAQQTLR